MPSFRSGKPAGRVLQSVAQSIPAASNTTLVFGTVSWQEGTAWDGTSSFVVDRAGKYLFTATVGRAATALSSPVTVRARVNGVTVSLAQSPATTSQFTTIHTDVLDLAVNDSVSCAVTFSSTVAVLTVPGSTHLAISRIGPERWTG